MREKLEEVISEMYDAAFDYKQSFEYSPAAELSRYADRLTKILKDSEGDKDE